MAYPEPLDYTHHPKTSYGQNSLCLDGPLSWFQFTTRTTVYKPTRFAPRILLPAALTPNGQELPSAGGALYPALYTCRAYAHYITGRYGAAFCGNDSSDGRDQNVATSPHVELLGG